MNAEYVRLHQHRLRVAVPYCDDTHALRTVVRTRTDLVDMRVAATNQLPALLETYRPGAKAVFADVKSPISLEFLTHYPTPNAARHMGEKRMAAFLVKARPVRLGVLRRGDLAEEVFVDADEVDEAVPGPVRVKGALRVGVGQAGRGPVGEHEPDRHAGGPERCARPLVEVAAEGFESSTVRFASLRPGDPVIWRSPVQ